jgi:hypothetical protein
MTLLSLLILPQPSLTAPYDTLAPGSGVDTVSVYLRVGDLEEAKADLAAAISAGFRAVILMPDFASVGWGGLETLSAAARGAGARVGLSLGGTLASAEGYMTERYKEDLRSVVGELAASGLLDGLYVLELLPYLNGQGAAEIPPDSESLLFGPLRDDVLLLGELVSLLPDAAPPVRTSIHLSYATGLQSALGWLGDIEGLDEISISLFQPHLNAMPSALASQVSLSRRLTDKRILLGPLAFSVHDDAHSEGMQSAWFLSCLDVASSNAISEVSVWEWADSGSPPFPVPELLEGRYGISGRESLSLVVEYPGPSAWVGSAANWADLVLGTVSVSGSTGVVTGNVLLSLLFRALVALAAGRRGKIRGGLLASATFLGTAAIHFSLGVPLLNSPTWWFSLPVYLYLYAGLAAGAYQMQVISGAVGRRRSGGSLPEGVCPLE